MAIERWRPFGTLVERDPFRDIQNEMNHFFDRFPFHSTANARPGGPRVGNVPRWGARSSPPEDRGGQTEGNQNRRVV